MKHGLIQLLVSVALLAGANAFAQSEQPSPAQPSSPSTPDKAAPRSTKADPDQTLAAQVALDRAGFSPGEIDGKAGSNTNNALRAFQTANGLSATGELDSVTVAKLGPVFQNALTDYTITADDAAGPFTTTIPQDMMKKASLPALGYTSVREAVAERFHVKEDLLQRLNAKSQFKEGDVIKVPDVEPFNAAAKPSAGPARSNGVARSGSAGATDRAARANDAGRAASPSARGASASARTDLVVTVTDANKSLTVEDGTGKVVFFAPVTVGSQNDPLPVGEWKVNGVQHHPPFNYNPDLFWDADPTHSKAKLAPGPNNPVGTVWIDLSKEHYGIHGTPEPSRIGHTESHGCIRLTNWDAARLASLVGPGTKVILR